MKTVSVELFDISICLIYNKKNQVLIGTMNDFGPDHGRIVFPGGELDVNEPQIEGCIRTVMKKTSLFIYNVKPWHIIKVNRIYLGQMNKYYIYKTNNFLPQPVKNSPKLINIHFVDINKLEINKMTPEFQKISSELFSGTRLYLEINSTPDEITIKTKTELYY